MYGWPTGESYQLPRLLLGPTPEALHLTAGVDEPLLAGEERVAARADVDAELWLGGPRLEPVAAAALDHGGLVPGMNV